METTEIVKVAVLEEQLKTVVKSVDGLSTKIDSLSSKIDDAYQKKEDFSKFYRDEFVPLRDNYNKIIWWVIGILITSLGSLILAVINYLTYHHTQ